MGEIEIKYPRMVLGLDVSTACIGVSIVLDKGAGTPEVLSITHVSPKVSSKIKGIEGLFLKKKIFRDEFLINLTGSGITDVVIEEPLLSSNNVNTVATLLRFNGMISDAIYEVLGIVPKFISSYDAREYSFPALTAIRKYNKKGEEYSLQHIKDAIKKNHLVLFGSYPFDIDKKVIMMNMVNELYPNIPWILDKKGEIKKENYDACDSLVCALAYINITRHDKPQKPYVVNYEITETDTEITILYTTGIWEQRFSKKMILRK